MVYNGILVRNLFSTDGSSCSEEALKYGRFNWSVTPFQLNIWMSSEESLKWRYFYGGEWEKKFQMVSKIWKPFDF